MTGNRKRPGGGLSRRQFLTGATAAGVALGMPPFLIGCGSDDGGPVASSPTPTPTVGPQLRETRTLHFDFSAGELLEPSLHAVGSGKHRAPLQEHTNETRDRHRASNPVIADVADERLTHFVEGADFPVDALQLVWVTGRHSAGGRAIGGMHIVIPTAAVITRADRALAAGRAPGDTATARAYGISVRGQDAIEGFNSYVTPFETAVSLVFQTHELINLNLDQGTSVIDLIASAPCVSGDPSCVPYIATLAAMIAQRWPATAAAGGWATLKQVLDAGGDPFLDGQGNAVLQYDVADDIAREACSVAGRIRKLVFDDPQYSGFQWHPTQGRTVEEQTSASAAIEVQGTAAGLLADIDVTADDGEGSTAHGISFELIHVVDQATRKVELQFRNRYLRYLAAFVQFADESGDLNLTGGSFPNTARAEFLGWINSNYTILGIPLTGDSVVESSVSFDVPAAASKAKVYFGGLGLGGQAFSPEAVQGTTLTLTFNIGLPAIFLVAGAAVSRNVQRDVLEFIQNEDTRGAIRFLISQAIELAGPQLANGVFGTANAKSATPVLAGIGNALLTTILANGQLFAGLIAIAADQIAEADITAAIPVMGAVMKVAAIGADIAAIAESVAESLASPALYVNTVRLTQSVTVTVDHDPDDFQFPALARAYEIVLQYDGASSSRRVSGVVEPGQSEPIVEVFDKAPAGGKVTVEVYLTSASGCLVGSGTLGPIDAAGKTALSLAIVEVLAPLTAATSYEPGLLLTYDSVQGRQWTVSATPPAATRAALCGGQDDALCALNGLTISQRTGMAGYSYQAGGQGGQLRCDGTPAAILEKFQNIFLGRDLGPDNGALALPCGFASPVGVVYDRLGPADGTGQNFVVQPTPDGFFVLPLTLAGGASATVQLNLITQSFGRFAQALDSLALVAGGYLVGVNRTNHKMEVLQLPQSAVDRVDAPDAVPFNVSKLGEGARVGLLDSPVAVTAFRSTVLILEDGNKRIQALDVHGNPVNQFQGGTTSIVGLETSATYLDIGAEGMGFMYVLSFVNDGLAANDYRLDVYTPDGDFLTRTTGVAAANIAVDTLRNVYTLNYQALAGAPLIEPSLSQWQPVTPEQCPS